VTEPTPLGGHDVELILRLLDMLKKDKRLILNRSDIGDRKIIERLAREYDTEIIAEIPYSKDIIKAYSNALPIHSKALESVIDEIE
jgi:MinD superfamily P-loop ATPase